ncbi:BTAD domain-containing putative transcriptional regulator [Streptomyces sp. NPDC047928]|uniref:AfsR/SARP family transcriptional regulator n=1 Tax=unclassified Streptomyces TaxID=2593676 RepID=UPI00371A22AE
MGPVQIFVLGPTQVHRPDGTPVPVGGARLRALLTVLALRAGRTVPVALLVDEVWDGAPPADAVAALQALVGRLRRALGADAVVSADGGYRLGADPDDVDLHRFERFTAEGVRALETGDPEKALALLDDALALWRGPALADLPDRAAEAARWEARRGAARRTRLAALVARGRAEEALTELAALCEAAPLDEPLHALRIRALRAAGRTAEALAAYEGVRRDLAARLGADPGPGLRALHADLLATPPPVPARSAAPTATAGPPPAAGAAGPIPAGPPPARPETAAGSGSGPATGSGPGSATGPAPGAVGAAAESAGTGIGVIGTGIGVIGTGAGAVGGGAGAGNLRARLTSFVGREEDIGVILGDLGRGRLVTLLGPGGAGKTRLSQEAAERGAARWPDGVWLAELAPVGDPDAVPDTVLTALGARETVLRGAGAEELRAAEARGDDPLARLTEHCAPRRMLILLDNCEHVVDAAAALAETVLTACPGVTVLATSREPLGVPGELVRPVGPLPDPAALRLLAERGAAALPGFRTDDDPDACAEICRRLDGLPLAIELAAARMRSLTPRQIADRLDDRFRLLTGGSRTLLPRQQTLRAVVDWSWELLEERERTALRRLSVFSGGCDLDAAEAVCGAPDTVDLLGSLVDKSLVVAAPVADGGMRYRLLETVAEYSAERLDEAGDRADAERRHLLHYRELARTTDPELRGAGQRAALDRLQREYENLRGALRGAIAAGAEQEALYLVLSLVWYWMLRDLRSEARHWAGAVAELGPDPFAPPVTPAPPLTGRSTDAPPPMDEEQLWEARRAVRLCQLASMDHEVAEWTTTRLDELHRISRAYRPGLPQTCRMPGMFWTYAVLMTGDAEQVRVLLDRTVDTCRELGWEWELAYALQVRANILANRSDWAGDAARDADESLELFVRLGDAWGAAEALSSRAEARERGGAFEGAAEDFQAAIGYAERLGAQSQVSLLRARYAGTLTELGRGEEGERILRAVLAEGGAVGYEAVPAARLYLALQLGRTGRTEEARRELEALREQFRSTTLSLFDGFTLGTLAWLDNLDGRYGDALDRAARALERSREPLSMMVAPHMPAVHLANAAWAMAGLGGSGARTAALLLGAHQAQLPPGHVPTPMERANWEQSLTLTRAVLGGEEFAAAYAEGGRLTLDEAAALFDPPPDVRSSCGTWPPPAAP